MFNDNFTTMEFVVNLLEELFGKSRDDQDHAQDSSASSQHTSRVSHPGAHKPIRAGPGIRLLWAEQSVGVFVCPWP
jgi:hypothetical protein